MSKKHRNRNTANKISAESGTETIHKRTLEYLAWWATILVIPITIIGFFITYAMGKPDPNVDNMSSVHIMSTVADIAIRERDLKTREAALAVKSIWESTQMAAIAEVTAIQATIIPLRTQAAQLRNSLPTVTPLPPEVKYGYFFESGIGGWITSEGDYKLAVLNTTDEQVYSGKRSLRIFTELSGTKEDDVYRHTEAVAYFDNNPLFPASIPPPYNLTGKHVSCYVYVPPELMDNGVSSAYIRIFVKDGIFENQFGDAVTLGPSNVGRWLQLSMIVGKGQGADTGFNPLRVIALGIRIAVPEDSTIDYTGPLYIDECVIS